MANHIKLDIANKESFKKTFSKLNFELFKISNAKIGDAVYRISRRVAEKAYANYYDAQYNGALNIVYYAERFENFADNNADVAIWFNFVDKDYVKINTRKTRYVDFMGVMKAERYWKKIPANYTLHYQVNVSGKKSWILEFGSGDRFEETKYTSIVGAKKWSFAEKRQYHFISKYTGLETWVYKGEEGRFSYLEDGNRDLRTPSMIAKNKFYSAGNKPSRALQNAVDTAKAEAIRFVKEAKVYK